MKELVGQYGRGANLSPKAITLLNQSKQRINLNLKNLEELGALQKPDLEILGQMLPDPLSAKAVYLGPDETKKQFTDFLGYIEGRTDDVAYSRGYEKAGVKPREETIPEGGNVTPQDDIKARALQKLKERGVFQ